MLNTLRNLFNVEQKRSAALPLIALHGVGQPRWTPRDYVSLAREGFNANAICYRAVRMISETAASVPWVAYQGTEELVDHPLLELLSNPNPNQSGRELLESLYGFLLISGNAYLEAVHLHERLSELYVLRPDRMKVVPSSTGWVEAYEYSVNGARQLLPREAVLHFKLFNPLDDYYGLAPLEAAQRAIDTHNAAAIWNKAMLDNAARPSGALVYNSGDGHLTQEQFDRLKIELEQSYQGALNAGRPLVLEGGLDWKEMGFSPKDMEFSDTKNAAAREVALAFGVPPMLLGIPGDNTFANYSEANRTFWRQTIVPLATRMAEALSVWLRPFYGDKFRLAQDFDQIEALASDRQAHWERLEAASFLTMNEKRLAAGYMPIDEKKL